MQDHQDHAQKVYFILITNKITDLVLEYAKMNVIVIEEGDATLLINAKTALI